MSDSPDRHGLAPLRYVGSSVPRKEDIRFLTGRGQHVGDLRLPGMLHVAIVRSVYPHANIASIEVERAVAMPGVVGVFTAADLEGKVGPFVESAREEIARTLADQIELDVASLPMPVLAEGRTHWVGQPLAAIVAVDPSIAEDAREVVDVGYEPLPALSDTERALDEDAPVLHPQLGSNVHTHLLVETGDVEPALRSAEHTLVERFEIGRQVAAALEPRGILAARDATDDGRLTVWATNTKPHLVRSYISRMLELPADDVRFVSPDMGGSFGGGIFSEDVLVPFLARELGQPVRWLEDRRENLTSTSHGRDQIHHVEVGYRSDGTIVALRDRFFMDSGAYNTYAITVAYNTVAHLRSQYRIDDFSVEGTLVLTNKAPATPVRGAGRPEATFVIERVIDIIAHDLDLDTIDVRLRNLIPADAMPYDMGIPYRDGVRMTYEEGDFPAQLHSALELFGYETWRQRQRSSSQQEKRIGIGVSAFVEGSGHGPFEGAIVRMDDGGRITVITGARPHGQGHETSLAQVAADQLGVTPDAVRVRAGDTAAIAHGRGSFASRTAVTAGNAVAIAAAALRRKIFAVAARMLEVDPSDLVLEDGRVFPTGAPRRGLDIREVAAAAAPGPKSLVDPGAMPGLAEEHYFVPPTATFGSGTHVAAVEVDVETGLVRVLDFVAVDECGRMINPMIVEGQVHGGVAHGIGNALLEEAAYDVDGQPLAITFMDYPLPTAREIPRIRVGHQMFPSSRNPLGAKGVGEGGAVGAPAAIANAVEDALRPLALRLTRIPLSPELLLRAIREARVEAGSADDDRA